MSNATQETKEIMKTERFRSQPDMTLFFLRGSKRWFAAAILFSGLLSLFDLINPKIIGYTVDSLIGEENARLGAAAAKLVELFGGREFLRTHLYLIGAAVVTAALMAALCRYLFGLMNSIGAECFVKRMRDCLYEQIAHLLYEWHGENKTGDIIQRCTSDVETIKRFVSEQLTNLCRILVMILMAVYFMFRIHWMLTLFAAVSIPVVVLYSFFFHERIGSEFEQVDSEEGKLSTIAQENLTGVRVVRAFGRESYERTRFEAKNEEYTAFWVFLMKTLSQFWAANDLISGVQILVVTVLGSWFCVNGSLTAGQYIAFVSYNAMLVWPVRSLGRVISEMSKAGISINRIMYIMNAEKESDTEQAQDDFINGDITFDHVSFGYGNGSRDVLSDVSFTIPKGSTVGILGGTGSGKSTLMLLLDRLYDLEPGRGEIRIGTVPIREIRARVLRRHIGLVLQEPYLFSRTLEENIAIGTENASHSDVELASGLACLAQTIEHFHDGYQTAVGERGVTLSGGQKQRTAIAQMLIRKPEIMIFDDSLSAVDAETDSKIRAAIAENTGESTVILISHRITTLMQADKILVMDRGSIREEGTHEELLKADGIYRKIYDLQAKQM